MGGLHGKGELHRGAQPNRGNLRLQSLSQGSRSGNYGRQGHGREETPGAEGSSVQKKNNNSWLLGKRHGRRAGARCQHGAQAAAGLTLRPPVSPSVPQRPCPAWTNTALHTASLKINQGNIFTFGKRLKEEEERSSSAGEGCGSWCSSIPSAQGRLLADRVPAKY